MEDASLDKKLKSLRVWNIVVGLILAAQAAVVALLTNDFRLPVTSTFLTGPPGSPLELQTLFNIPTGWAFLHFWQFHPCTSLIASPWVFPWYKRNLLLSRNYGRWIEYFFSSSIMIVLISQICGISDIAALGAIFGINASMILFGALQEKYEKPGKPNLLSFWFGSFAGIIPWIAILIYVLAPGQAAAPPTFVYAIVISLFVFFNCFAVNMILQYKQIGPWKDYLFGEKAYIFLSLTAKALLAWQVFAAVLFT